MLLCYTVIQCTAVGLGGSLGAPTLPVACSFDDASDAYQPPSLCENGIVVLFHVTITDYTFTVQRVHVAQRCLVWCSHSLLFILRKLASVWPPRLTLVRWNVIGQRAMHTECRPAWGKYTQQLQLIQSAIFITMTPVPTIRRTCTFLDTLHNACNTDQSCPVSRTETNQA